MNVYFMLMVNALLELVYFTIVHQVSIYILVIIYNTSQIYF